MSNQIGELDLPATQFPLKPENLSEYLENEPSLAEITKATLREKMIINPDFQFDDDDDD